jgi:hypothetical protein
MFSYTSHKYMTSAKAKDNEKCQLDQLCKDDFLHYSVVLCGSFYNPQCSQ